MKKRHRLAAAAGILAALGCCGTVRAAEGALLDYNLETMVITATRNWEEASRVPASVSVITAKDIAKLNATTITDALKQSMGVFVNRPKGLAETANGIEMRGFGDSNIMVLYDGMPMNMAYDNGVNWNAIPVDNVERIEIVRGAASSLYGGRATGAVINIITKEPAQDLKIHAGLIGGSHSTWRKNLSLSQKPTDKLSYRLSFEQRSTDGFENKVASSTSSGSSRPKGTEGTGVVVSRRVNGNPRYIIGTPGDGSGRSTTYNASLTYEFDKARKLRYSYTHDKFRYWSGAARSYIKDSSGNPLFSGSVRLPTGKWLNFDESYFTDYYGRRDTDIHSLQYRDDASKIIFNLGVSNVKDAGYSTGDYFDGSTPGNDTRYPSKSYRADFQKVWDASKRHTVVAGFNVQRDSMTRTTKKLAHWHDWDSATQVTDITGGRGNNLALFLQDEYGLSDHFKIHTGVRFDYYKKYDGYDNNKASSVYTKYDEKSYTEWSPKVAFQYSPNDTTDYYLSYGHSFTPPSLYRLYRTDSYYVGNPDLEPETSDTFELGVNKKFGPATSVHAALYRSFTEDLITSERIPGSAKRRYVNEEKAVRTGMEMELKHKFDDKWSGYFNYQWQIVEDDNGDRIYDYPKDIFHAGIEYNHDKWDGFLDAEYVSGRNYPGEVSNVYLSNDCYTTFNAGLSYRINKNLKATFTVNNILDRDYYTWYKADGRNWYLGVQMDY